MLLQRRVDGDRAQLIVGAGVGACGRVNGATLDSPGGMRTEMLDHSDRLPGRVHDITAECTSFVAGGGATACCTCGCRTRPPGLAIIETGAGSDDDLLAAFEDAAARGRPLAAPARQARARP